MQTDPLLTGDIAPVHPAADDRFPVCVVGIVHNLKSEVLLIKNGKPGRGWELPGGKKKRGESWGDAVRREFLEETGISNVAWSDENPIVIDGWPTSSAGYESIVIIVEGAVLDDVFSSSALPIAERSSHGILSSGHQRASIASSPATGWTWARWRGANV